MNSFTNNRTTHTRNRGSVLILTVVVITLIALLGATYVQMAMIDRTATRQLNITYIDQVVATEGSRAQNILAADLMNDAGLFFSSAHGDEHIDYPITNTTASRQVRTIDGNPVATAGGSMDDAHLASSVPDFTGPSPAWGKISNPSGIFLRLPRFDTSLADPKPREDIVDFSGGNWRYSDGSDTPLRISDLEDDSDAAYAPLGVDADGDGIADSRWTWAELNQIGDRQYVVAMRFVDLSSMINLNTAGSLTDGSGLISGSERVRGNYPTSVDLSKLAFYTRQAGYRGEIEAMFTDRGMADPYTAGYQTPVQDPPTATAADNRAGYWLATGRQSAMLPFGLTEEFELRNANGLNGPVRSRLEESMPNLLRAAADESSYDDIAGVSTIENFFLGGAQGSQLSTRTLREIRHFLTVHSGHAAWTPNWNDTFYTGLSTAQSSIFSVPAGSQTVEDAGNRVPRYDLVYQDGGADTADQGPRTRNIMSVLLACFRAGSSRYLSGLAGANDAEAAIEMALAIQNYSDSDTACARYAVGAGGLQYFGLEALPFVREVYIQWAYEDKLTAGRYDRWQRVDNSISMAIDIANPFDRPIDLTETEVRVLVRRGTNQASVELKSRIDGGNKRPAWNGTLDPRDGAPDRRSVIVYADADQAPSPQEDTVTGDLKSDLNFDAANWIKATDGAFQFPLPDAGSDHNLDDVTVELQIKDPGPDGRLGTADDTGDWVTYDRFRLDGLATPIAGYENADHTPHDIPSLHGEADGTFSRTVHVQIAYARDGREGRFMSNKGKEPIGFRNAPNPSSVGNYYADLVSGAITYDTDLDSLAEDDKQGALGAPIEGETLLDDIQFAIANRPIFNVAELGWIPMIGFINRDGGDVPTRLSGPDGNGGILANAALRDRRLFLDVTSNAARTTLADVGAVPHAALVMDAFTTLSPRNDGLDNDGEDGADDLRENLIPGTINVNTASMETLALAMPLPESLDDAQTLAEAIIDYREANTRPAGFRTDKGIASIGELLFVNPAGNGDPANMQRYGQDGVAVDNDTLSFYPMPEQTTASTLDFVDSPEERMARFHLVNQLLATRSDYYLVWMVIRGYDAADYSTGPVESARVLFLLDRSAVTSPSDQVKILGAFRSN